MDASPHLMAPTQEEEFKGDKRLASPQTRNSGYFERLRSGWVLVRILVRGNGGGPRNVLIEREDGSRVVRPFRGLRRWPLKSASPHMPAVETSFHAGQR